MANPWLKKNPFLSMWLSGANAIFANARGQTAALAKRQTAAVMKNASATLVNAIAGTSRRPAAKRKKRKA